jgi:hypothetical protein
LFYELCAYSLSQHSTEFIHQYVVDAYAAQHAGVGSKPIQTAFALIGLYLMAERGYTGRQVQLAHMTLAKSKRQWPRFIAPESAGTMNVETVLRQPPGDSRDQMIRAWARDVWQIWSSQQHKLDGMLAILGM